MEIRIFEAPDANRTDVGHIKELKLDFLWSSGQSS
jgi:hypothetical protein